MNQQSFNSSLNFNKSLSIEGSSQNSSTQKQKSQQTPALKQNEFAFQNEHFSQLPLLDPKSQTESQKAQNQQFKSDFDAADQTDFQKLRNELSKHSHIKNTQKEEEKQSNSFTNQNKFQINAMFERSKSSNGEKNFLYQYHQNNEEEGRIVLQSLKEELAKQTHFPETETSQDKFEFMRYRRFNLDGEGFITLEVLGEGLHGLVIKVVNRDDNENAVIKLYRKVDKEAFIDETIILSNIQKAKRLGQVWNVYFNSKSQDHYHTYFETNEYYGLVIKEGLGSLGNFQEYLKERDIKLSAEELFVFTWVLLDTCSCLHKINYCHRDIKPANIVINPQTFLPELIDYSLASEFSRAKKGDYGTEGYRMEDFAALEEKMESLWQDHLKSGDYFALGKTMLEVAYPTFTIISVKDMKSQLEKLKKIFSMKIIGRLLEVCIFGDIKSKENMIREYVKSAELSLNQFDGNQSQKSENMFDPKRILQYAKNFREKHLENFKVFIGEKLRRKKVNEEPRLKEISDFIIPKESQNQILISTSETIMFAEEEKWIQENFKKDPEQAAKKCKEVMDQLLRTNSPIPDSKLLSTLIAVLYLSGWKEDASSLCEKMVLLDSLPQDCDWTLLNNSAIVYFAANLNRSFQFFLDQCKNILRYFKDFASTLFIEDLKFVYYSMPNNASIEKNEFIEAIAAYPDGKLKNVLLLTFFRVKKIFPHSLFFLNYGYALSSHLDSMFDEAARASIKKFVSDMNVSGRKKAFNFLKFSPAQSILFTLVTFCQIFENLALVDLAELNYLKKECIEIISNKKIWATELHIAKNREEKIIKALLEYELIYVMSGFFILYNIKHNMRPKYTLEEENEKSLQRYKQLLQLSEEKRDDFVKEYKAKKNSDKQRFLDSIMSFIYEISDTEFEYSILLTTERKPLRQISILGTELDDLILSQDGAINVEEYGLKYSKKEKFSSIKSLRMECKIPFLEGIKIFFDSSTMNKLQSLEKIVLKFRNYSHNPSLFTGDDIETLPIFEEISKHLSSFTLTSLDMTLNSEIRISNEDFRPLSKFISKQVKLEFLKIKFDLSLINPDGVESFAKDLAELQQLQKLSILFENCPRIDSESILVLLLTLKKLPELKYVNLEISACSNITSLEKPQDLPFKIDIRISLVDDNISVSSIDYDESPSLTDL